MCFRVVAEATLTLLPLSSLIDVETRALVYHFITSGLWTHLFLPSVWLSLYVIASFSSSPARPYWPLSTSSRLLPRVALTRSQHARVCSARQFSPTPPNSPLGFGWCGDLVEFGQLLILVLACALSQLYQRETDAFLCKKKKESCLKFFPSSRASLPFSPFHFPSFNLISPTLFKALIGRHLLVMDIHKFPQEEDWTICSA